MSENAVVVDKVGNPLNVGDEVVYARSQGDQLHFGTIADVFPLPSNSGLGSIKVRNTDTRRVSVNTRPGKDVLNLTYFKESNPEVFI